MPGKDFRKSRRFLVNDCTAQCRALGLKSLLHKTREPFLPILNLGVGGMQLLTGSSMKLGEKTDLSISTPDLPEPLKLRGVIKWVELLGGGQLFRVGVAFTEMMPEALQALRALEEVLWPRQQELLDAGAERLRLPPSLAKKLHHFPTGRSSDAAIPWHSQTSETPAGDDGPALPPEMEEREPAGVVADSPEAIDALLSKAISKQKSQGERKTKPSISTEGRVALVEVHDRILQPEVLGEGDAPVDPERTVARYLEIFVREGRECCAYRLSDDSMARARPPSFAPGTVVVFVKGAMPMSGDLALVETDDATLFRQVFTGNGDTVRLRPLNARYPEAVVARSCIKAMSRAAGRYDQL